MAPPIHRGLDPRSVPMYTGQPTGRQESCVGMWSVRAYVARERRLAHSSSAAARSSMNSSSRCHVRTPKEARSLMTSSADCSCAGAVVLALAAAALCPRVCSALITSASPVPAFPGTGSTARVSDSSACAAGCASSPASAPSTWQPHHLRRFDPAGAQQPFYWRKHLLDKDKETR
jgi:hypothetical protein